MLTGIADGGPHDGVMLSAEPTWDGKMLRFGASLNAVEDRRGHQYLPGHYYWSTSFGTWLWSEDGKTPDARTQR